MASKGKTTTQMVKLIVGAGQASPQPPVGPALGSKGVKAIDFAKDFNARTAHYIPGTPIPAIVTVKPDRTYTYVLKSPPSTWLLKQAAGVEKGAANPNQPVGEVSLKHLYEIAKIKQMDENHKERTLETIVKQLVGVARSCGITVVL